MLFWVCYILLWLPLHIFSPFKVYGKKNIEKGKKYIIVSNHKSNFDPILYDFVFKSKNRYLAKKELFSNKFSKFFMKNVFGSIEIDRQKGLTLTQVKEICKVIENNQNLGIFPEGTRRDGLNKDDDVKGGACFFAIKTRTPIIPCFVVKKHCIFRKNVILVGKPFEFDEFYNKKLDKEALHDAEILLRDRIVELNMQYQNYLNEQKLVKQLKRQKSKRSCKNACKNK